MFDFGCDAQTALVGILYLMFLCHHCADGK